MKRQFQPVPRGENPRTTATTVAHSDHSSRTSRLELLNYKLYQQELQAYKNSPQGLQDAKTEQVIFAAQNAGCSIQ